MEKQGYLSEIFSSFQGEGGTIPGSCFGKKQIFIRFAGCNIANEEFGTSGCFFCDTPRSQAFELETYQYEKKPSSQEFTIANNPIKIQELITIIKNLITIDVHSMSLTGGEPMCQLEFLLEIGTALKKNSITQPLYLETNGTILPDELELAQIGELFQYCCCDIKDRSSQAAEVNQWETLVKRELEFIRTMISVNVLTFAKIIVTSHTKIKDIDWIAHELSNIKYQDGTHIGLAIQPVYLEQKKLKKQFSISNKKLNQIFQAAANHLPPDKISLSIQAHKFLNLL
jgi:organic radical activating enzyme